MYVYVINVLLYCIHTCGRYLHHHRVYAVWPLYYIHTHTVDTHTARVYAVWLLYYIHTCGRYTYCACVYVIIALETPVLDDLKTSYKLENVRSNIQTFNVV